MLIRIAFLVVITALSTSSVHAACGDKLENTSFVQSILKFFGIRPRLLPTVRAIAKGELPKYQPGEIGNANSYLDWRALRKFNRGVLGKFHAIEVQETGHEQPFFVKGGPSGEGRDSFNVDFNIGPKDGTVTLTRAFQFRGKQFNLVVKALTSAQEALRPRGRYDTMAADKIRYRSIDDLLRIEFRPARDTIIYDEDIAPLVNWLQERFDIAIDSARASAGVFKGNGGFEGLGSGKSYGGAYKIEYWAKSGETNSFMFGHDQFYAIDTLVATLVDVLDLQGEDFVAARNFIPHYSEPDEIGKAYIAAPVRNP